MIRLPCDQCAATGWATHGDRHTRTNMDQCHTCEGTGWMPARTGETPQASAPIGREEWCRRFKAEMIRVAAFAAVDPPYGLTWAEYAEECAEPYYDDPYMVRTPEEHASAEVMVHDTGDEPQ